MVKNCDRGLENALRGRRSRAAFQARGHSFSPYGPTQSRQITCLSFSCSKLVLQPIINGLVYATLSLNRVACRALMHQSIPAVPIPPGNRGAFAHVFSPGGGAFAILLQPGDWALAYPGATPGHLTQVFSKDG